MSLMDLGDTLTGATEPKAVPKGEYNLRVVGVRPGEDKNGYSYIMPRLEVINPPKDISNPKDFTHFLHIPSSSMKERDPKRWEQARWNYRNFLEACGLDIVRPHDPEEDLVGKTFSAILGVSKDERYGEQNNIDTLLRRK